MLSKDIILRTVEGFENEIEIDELLERLVILNNISEAENDIKQGRVYTEEEANKIIDGWLE
jgi:predicted transcriptional regulator